MKLDLAMLTLLFFAISCNTTEPPAEEGPKPGKRDYVWSTDTLSYPGSVWAISPTRVWAGGSDGTIFGFDGIQWTSTNWARSSFFHLLPVFHQRKCMPWAP
ncbi:MAG: hypothetical protein O7D34_01960 [Ignavibacteria bacterium]|nr:hypothetical protein [Ignavibacteria bacterium]